MRKTHVHGTRSQPYTHITANAGVHTRDPQHLPWLASRTGRCSIGANAMHVGLPNTRDDGFGPQQQGPLPG
eukprot:5617407-Prymnesium_polylepis.1